ncbi:MAG: hypothetical protein JXA33_23810 [Anaerolineae bacterium]|nr:hypothetical protein [Anaerolineae bacterium]
MRQSDIFLSLGVLMFIVSGCQLLPALLPSPTESPTLDMLPALPEYNTVEDETLTDYISGLSQGASLLAGQPELAATALVVDQIISCYQDIGAVQARVYSHKEMPLSAGAIAIADQDALKDPINLFRCVVPAIQTTGAATTQSVQIEPCSASYTLERDGNEFYIVYAGTTPDICQAFCTNLEGCTEHR